MISLKKNLFGASVLVIFTFVMWLVLREEKGVLDTNNQPISKSIVDDLSEQTQSSKLSVSKAEYHSQGLDEEQCLMKLKTLSSPPLHKALKNAQLNAFYEEITKSSSITPEVLSSLAYRAGISSSDITELDYFGSVHKDKRLSRPENASLLLMTKGADVVRWLKLGQYEELYSAIDSGYIPVDGYFLQDSILTVALKYNPTIERADLIGLIEAGINVNLPDLIEVNKRKYPDYILEILAQNSSFDFSNMWFDGVRFNSLATVAVSQLNHSALSFWLSKGVPLYDNEKAVNALSFLPRPNGGEEIEQGNNILQLLSSNRLPPVSSSMRNSLIHWYGEFAESLPVGDMELTPITEKLESAIRNLTVIVAKSNRELEESQEIIKICSKILDGTLGFQAWQQGQLFEKNKNSNANNLKTSEQRQLRLMSSLERLAFQDKQNVELTQQMMSAASVQNWQEALDSAQELSDSEEAIDEEIFDVLIIQALSQNAPIEVFEQLFAKGAKLPDSASHILAIYNHLDLMKKLLAMDLDLHSVDQYGKNALSYSIEAAQGKEMFNFLLQQGVSFKATDHQLDALDLALAKCEFSSLGIEYALTLIEMGAPIENSHRQGLTLLSYSNPEHFMKLDGAF